MFENPFAQFLMELIRSLLVEEVSGRVRGPMARLLGRGGTPSCRRAILSVHRRNRERLLHKLVTELKDNL